MSDIEDWTVEPVHDVKSALSVPPLGADRPTLIHGDAPAPREFMIAPGPSSATLCDPSLPAASAATTSSTGAVMSEDEWSVIFDQINKAANEQKALEEEFHHEQIARSRRYGVVYHADGTMSCHGHVFRVHGSDRFAVVRALDLAGVPSRCGTGGVRTHFVPSECYPYWAKHLEMKYALVLEVSPQEFSLGTRDSGVRGGKVDVYATLVYVRVQ